MKAIHNRNWEHCFFWWAVISSSKIQFESNSQRLIKYYSFYFRCYQFLKDTIWKQFTTYKIVQKRTCVLLSVPQRYNLKAIHNKSKSCQPSPAAVISSSKIQFESNSQQGNDTTYLRLSCYQFLKDTIWKQFTTNGRKRQPNEQLLSVPQRYNLKAIHNTFLFLMLQNMLLSVPQRYNLKAIHNCQLHPFLTFLLLSVPQRYNLKAIHNLVRGVCILTNAVISSSKIQFESNSQLSAISFCVKFCCYQFLKDTIWKQFTTAKFEGNIEDLLLSVPQRYNLKAIHNAALSNMYSGIAVISSSKIQFESNSQRRNTRSHTHSGCYQFLKDTIWKQFTTYESKDPKAA